MKKDNVHGIRLGDAELDKDIKIVSTCFIAEHNELVYHEDGIPTPFEKDAIGHLYYIDNHEIDVPLAIQLGLGVVEDVVTKMRFIYNADDEKIDDTVAHELLRLGMYYQIKFPEYHDRKLDSIMNGSPDGEEYLRILIDSDSPIRTLKEIFKSQKGKGNNVVEFKKRV